MPEDQTKPAHVSRIRVVLIMSVALAVGVFGWWYNMHTVQVNRTFSVKLALLAPMCLCVGITLLASLLFPDKVSPSLLTGPLANKGRDGIVLLVFLVLMMVLHIV